MISEQTFEHFYDFPFENFFIQSFSAIFYEKFQNLQISMKITTKNNSVWRLRKITSMRGDRGAKFEARC